VAMKKSVKILLIMLMLMGLASCASLQVASPPPTWPIPEGIKTVDVNGYHMAYQEAGSGTAVVFVHGSLADYRTWDTQVADFSKNYRVIAVSLRHYYPEKWNGVGDDFSVAQHASDVAALIKKLKLGKVHLVGNSRGGTIVLTVAILYPEIVRSLILEEANMEPLMPETPEKQKRVAEGKARGESIRAALATDGREKAGRIYMTSYGVDWDKLPDRPKQITLENIGTCTESGERGKFSCADIQKFNFPILLLNGEKSMKLYRDMNDALMKCKSDIPAPIIIPNAPHLAHRGNPEFFNRTVLDFLNKH
jgi:esterase